LANFLVAAIAVVRVLQASVEDACQILSDVMEGFRRCLPAELTDESEVFTLGSLVNPVFELGVGNPVHPEMMAQFYEEFFETLWPILRNSPEPAIQNDFFHLLHPIVKSGWLRDYSEIFGWIEELLVQHGALVRPHYGDTVRRVLDLLTEMAKVPELPWAEVINTSCTASCCWGDTRTRLDPRKLWDVWRTVTETHQNTEQVVATLIEWAGQALLRDPAEMVVVAELLRLPDADEAYALSKTPLRALLAALRRSHD
jgi:hypothetical protein